MINNVFYAKCLRCTGELKPLKKTIETISPEHNYETKKARLHECIECGSRIYVREESE